MRPIDKLDYSNSRNLSRPISRNVSLNLFPGGYEDDVDNGEEFLYTGSGGRDLGNLNKNVKIKDSICTHS